MCIAVLGCCYTFSVFFPHEIFTRERRKFLAVIYGTTRIYVNIYVCNFPSLYACFAFARKGVSYASQYCATLKRVKCEFCYRSESNKESLLTLL